MDVYIQWQFNAIMVHNLIDLISAVVTGYCKIHGTNSKECGAAREAGSLAMGGLLLVGLVSALSKK